MQRDSERVLDEYLVLSSQAGSRAAFEELARRWMPRIVRYAARTLGWERASADVLRDVVQETWVAVVRGLRRLEDPAHFPAWTCAIASRKCADAIRADDWGRSRDLAAAIARLPEAERSVVHLYYGEDLGVAEIAAVLGVPPGTVKSRLHHAREALKRFLTHEPQRRTS